MSESFTVGWELSGEINGESIRVDGGGSADPTTGEYVLNLTAAPGFPVGFDPAASHMICNFALGGYVAAGPSDVSLRSLVDREMFVAPARMARIFDGSGEELARLEAQTTLRVDEDTITVTNYLTGFSHLPAEIADIWGEESLLPAGGMRATGVAHFGIRLSDGTSLDGLTVVPYRFDRMGPTTPATRVISAMRCEWGSPRSVTLTSASRWTALNVDAVR